MERVADRRPGRQQSHRPLAIALVAAAAMLLGVWLTGWATPALQDFSPLQQTSPLDPFATDTPDPFAFPTDTPDPFIFPTDTPDPFAFPTDTPDPFVFPTDTPDPFAFPTDIPTDSFDGGAAPVTTETPGTTIFVPEVVQSGEQAVESAPPTPQPAPLRYVGSVLSGMFSVAAWIWLLCGSLIFFTVAGVVGGLYAARHERHRYELYVLEPAESPYLAVEEAQPDDDDTWPASLP